MEDKIVARSTADSQGASYDIPYFAARNQDRDRPALWFYERIVRRWIKPGTVLDYGCGTGFMTRRLARHYDVAGYDVSPYALEAVRKNVPSAAVYGHEEHIPDAAFSGIVSLHVLEHIERSTLPLVLSCWRNALRPRGRVLCVVPDTTGRGLVLAGKHWTSYGDPTHVTLMGHNEWRDLFANCGFTVTFIGTDGLWCLPYREGKGKLRDGFRYSIPTVVQFLLGRLILPAGSGESAIFLLEKA